jgi:hypothetical protein
VLSFIPRLAGKTNIAMMCVLREIGAHIQNGVLQKGQLRKRNFKFDYFRNAISR